MSIITLTTDFGCADWFVAGMKGAALSVNPTAVLVDVTHQIPPGDIRAGAFVLRAAYRSFPRGAIHVAVVDPGVGSKRAAIVAQTSDYWFVGPDNGVLSGALERETVQRIHRLENDAYFFKPVSATFHGRDIFAPVAAHLTLGVSAALMGRAQVGFKRLKWTAPRREGDSVLGHVAYVDRFGNAITDIGAEMLTADCGHSWRVFVRGVAVGAVCEYFQQETKGGALAVVGSLGLVEIAVNGGNAAKTLDLKMGEEVELRVLRKGGNCSG